MQIKKLYNIMSLLFQKIESFVSERDFERMRNLTPEYETAIMEALKRKFPDMIDQNTGNKLF